MQDTSANPPLENKSNWLIIPRIIFDEAAVSANSTEELIGQLLEKSTINNQGANFIILADGEKFVADARVAFVTNASVTVDLMESIERHLKTLESCKGNNPYTFQLAHSLLDIERKKLLSDFYMQMEKCFGETMVHIRKFIQQQEPSNDKGVLAAAEKGLLWAMFHRACHIAKDASLHVYKLFVAGQLGTLMKDDVVWQRYDQWPLEKKTYARDMISSLIKPEQP